MSLERRALHFVFKVADRASTMAFYRDLLGMTILRHEEFEEGCKASCNGPYDGRWSKTMVGYGPEDVNFVVELTYNYTVGSYILGNDFKSLTVRSNEALERAKKDQERWNLKTEEETGRNYVLAPGGYKFYLEESGSGPNKLSQVSLASSNLARSIAYWSELLGMRVLDSNDKRVHLSYGDDQATLELLPTEGGEPVDHATAFGRTAFALPTSDLAGIQKSVQEKSEKILTPLVSLDTPGKATVSVVILADPDGHEICFVGDEAFRELSKVDPKAEELLDRNLAEDKSTEWYTKKGKSKDTA